MKRVLLAFVVVLGAIVVSAQSDPSIGTWKLNVGKSKYDPGPVPSSNTVTIAAAGQGIKVSAKGVDGEGRPTSTDYTATYDGKETPVTGNPAYDTLSIKRINASTTETTRKKAGKVVQTAKRVVSSDGKTMTITTTGTDEKGRKINNVGFFDKQ